MVGGGSDGSARAVGFQAVLLQDGRVLAYSGDGDGSDDETFSFETYNATANTWTVPTPFWGSSGFGQSGVLLADGHVLFSGGYLQNAAGTTYESWTRRFGSPNSLALVPT